MDSSIEIIGEVQGTTQGRRNNSVDLEVVYDGQGNQTIKKQEDEDQPVEVKQTKKSRSSSRPRKPVKNYHLQQQEQEAQEAQLKLSKRLVKDQKFKAQHQLKLQKKKLLQQKEERQGLCGKKRKASNIQLVDEVKAPKAARSEVGGAGTLKHRKKDKDIQIVFEWDPATVISERQCVEEWAARNVITMFDQENTLPFIARYRKDKTGNMEVEKLREIQNSYSQLKHVQERVVKLLKNETSKLPEERKESLLRVTTMHEVEHLTAAYKSSGKRTYAERARELGLEPAALEVLRGNEKYFERVPLYPLIKMHKEGVSSIEEVEQGVQHIIADIISKDPKVLDFVRQLMKTCNPMLECSKSRKGVKKDQGKTKNSKTGPSNDLCSKYELYFNYRMPAWNTKPHAILAMNRGDHQGVLSIKINIHDDAYVKYFNFCHQQWLHDKPKHAYSTHIMMLSVEDSWERLVKPFIQRQIRSELTERAEIASVEVFAANLRKLLLTPPLRGKTVLAIDPGFANGCKVGVTNASGEKLLTTTIYPFGKKKNNHIQQTDWNKDHNAQTLREIVHKYECDIFAVGNGTACREMESYLTQLISQKCFEPYNVQYTIVNEQGASIYSCSEEGRAEFPGLDPNHISAVSLARRLQDPLLEYIKVHPMHMGVGMYQHDIPEKLLNASLDSVMTECVSFVGVDINSASEYALRKLSGLSKVRAANIVEYRKTKGPFMNREGIKSVKGIGPRTFEQCAGFIKILPETLELEVNKTPQNKKRVTKESTNPLDRTMIHPESYDASIKFLNLVGVRPQNIGEERFICSVRQYMQGHNLEETANQCGVSIPTMQLIVEGLAQSLDYDIRAQFEKPLFRKGITSIDDIRAGTKLTGTVRNVTHFGAFVDCGLGTDGLVHTNKMRGMRLELGNIIEVSVLSVEKERGRIGLMLESIIG